MPDLPANQKSHLAVQNFIKDDGIQKMISERLKSRAGQFTTSLLSLVNSTPKIAECTPITVVQAALTAASLDLPINQNLGFAYIVPYKNKGTMEAQFQMGWKGFVQLAQRSGQFRYINSSDVREGEIGKRDRLSGAMEFNWIEDEKTRDKTPVVGYVSYFELMNGFSSTLYMSVDEIDAHGKRYSQSYKAGFGPWKDNYPAMAKKTVTKLNLSSNAPMSTEPQMQAMQEAIVADQSVQDDRGVRYIDNDDEVIEVLTEEQIEEINSADLDHLKQIQKNLSVELKKQAAPYVAERMKSFNG